MYAGDYKATAALLDASFCLAATAKTSLAFALFFRLSEVARAEFTNTVAPVWHVHLLYHKTEALPVVYQPVQWRLRYQYLI